MFASIYYAVMHACMHAIERDSLTLDSPTFDFLTLDYFLSASLNSASWALGSSDFVSFIFF